MYMYIKEDNSIHFEEFCLHTSWPSMCMHNPHTKHVTPHMYFVLSFNNRFSQFWAEHIDPRTYKMAAHPVKYIILYVSLDTIFYRRCVMRTVMRES